MSYFLGFAVILSSLCNWKGAQSYKKLPEAIVPKVGHGPKMGQNGFDRACVSVVFLFLLFYSPFIWSQWGDGHGNIGLLQARFLLPCQWKYWHRAKKNRVCDKAGFGMYNLQNVEKSGFGQPVCVSVCLAVSFSANSHRRKGEPIELKL